MGQSTIWRRLFLGAPMLASIALAVSLPAPAAAAHPTNPRPPKAGPRPRAITGGVSHVRGTSALLGGAVNPHNVETTYYFQYGPTIAYGHQTPTASAGAGGTTVKVGQTASPFLPGYHYRLVATNTNGVTTDGSDRIFTTTSSRPKVEINKPTEPVVFGSTAVLSGTLTGPGAANHKLVLQGSPFPYLEAFTNVGLPVLTNALGRFSFHVPNLTQATQFRAVTTDALPMFSQVVTEHVALRVTLKVRSAGRKGFVRLYGTVAPAEVGARVLFQLQRPARPGRTERTEERTTKFVTSASTTAKRATRTLSRFSSIVNITRTGRYRALVVLRKGALVSGSSSTVLIHGGPAPKRNAQRKKH
jgi:hypothetical protein